MLAEAALNVPAKWAAWWLAADFGIGPWLAEFGYGGKLLPTFPKWLIDGTKPQRLSWWLKSEALPFIYWNGMLKGHEWLASPKPLGKVKATA